MKTLAYEIAEQLGSIATGADPLRPTAAATPGKPQTGICKPSAVAWGQWA
ncbi:MAG: hypothetical protein M5U34_00790 [Chloroflexi bacterium]|nr:hypothetical protein [Chloroflexota bacterium]